MRVSGHRAKNILHILAKLKILQLVSINYKSFLNTAEEMQWCKLLFVRREGETDCSVLYIWYIPHYRNEIIGVGAVAGLPCRRLNPNGLIRRK